MATTWRAGTGTARWTVATTVDRLTVYFVVTRSLLCKTLGGGT